MLPRGEKTAFPHLFFFIVDVVLNVFETSFFFPMCVNLLYELVFTRVISFSSFFSLVRRMNLRKTKYNERIKKKNGNGEIVDTGPNDRKFMGRR